MIMDFHWTLEDDGKLFYELGDWTNELDMTELKKNFTSLSIEGQCIIAMDVIKLVIQQAEGDDDEADVNAMRSKFLTIVEYFNNN